MVILGAGASCAAIPKGDKNGKWIPAMSGFVLPDEATIYDFLVHEGNRYSSSITYFYDREDRCWKE